MRWRFDLRILILIFCLLPVSAHTREQNVHPVYPGTIDDQFVDYPISGAQKTSYGTVILFLDNTTHGNKIVCAVHSEDGHLIVSKEVETTNFTTTVMLSNIGLITGGVARCVDAEHTK